MRTLLSAARQVQRGSGGPQTFDGAGWLQASILFLLVDACASDGHFAHHVTAMRQVQRGSDGPRTSDVADPVVDANREIAARGSFERTRLKAREKESKKHRAHK